MKEIRANFVEIDKKIIIKCPKCRKKLRLPSFRTKKLTVRCVRCNREFKFNYKKYHTKRLIVSLFTYLLLITLLSCTVIFPLVGISKLEAEINKVKDAFAEKVKEVEELSSSEINAFKEEYSQKLTQINTDEYRDQLHKQASEYYVKIWNGRENYTARYAITPREKARLEMLKLSKDRNKTVEEIVRSIAIKVAPRNSDISVYTTSKGLRLDIDFDMSELTSGEIGSRTKHTTLESLKKEVIKLISMVTNDVYEFCRDLNLGTIAIGCRHFVKEYYYEHSSLASTKNTVLYKIRLDKKDIKKLEHNPFLDIYSTTKYFKVEANDFPNLTLDTSYEK